MTRFRLNRRNVLKGAGAGLVALSTPTIFTRGAWAQEFCNDPSKGKIIFGFNVPQTGSYAEEGLDELKGYELAVKHINGEGDGGMLKTLKPLALKGNGVLGRKGGAAPGAEGRNMDHLCLRIEPFDEAAIRSHLEAHGVAPGEIVSRYGAEGQGPSMYITDPDGNSVELKGPPDGR